MEDRAAGSCREGGAVEARQFNALVDQLNRAKTSKEFAASATSILDSIDALEAVFTRSPV